MDYRLLKAFHVIFIVAWFAGLFYIFRLFVYHVENWEEKKVCEIFSVMERKLLNYIMTPALVVSLCFGLAMLVQNNQLLKTPWMHIKLTLVFLLMVYHAYSYYVFFKFKNRQKILSSKACRIINEVPTLILIAVCILAFLKPIF